jgi:D-beta-D-heptose 7-phosphate kinase / D-beta-D-heptose 1-phosphate adenosyltransferase
MSSDLIELVQRLGEPRVLVIGDLMLDRYIWGDAERISQEAPVILLRADKREERLGGASSVATMLKALGAKVFLAGVVGNDSDARRVREILADLQIDQEAVLSDLERPTTVKERYIGRAQARHPQQMLRVDYEQRHALSNGIESKLNAIIHQHIAKVDIVLVSDYDKGVCTPRILAQTIQSGNSKKIRVIADPIRGKDYRKYFGCSAITPNRLEAGLATGRTIRTLEDAYQSGRELRESLHLEAAIVTLDKDGMALVHRNGTEAIFPTRPRQVYDITGAGDMVMSVLALTLAAGIDYPDAIRLANVAGGLEVEKIGVATVTREEILHDLLHSGVQTPEWNDLSRKVKSLPQLVSELDHRRRNGQRIAFTNGCFDVLHAGHVQYLNEARSQADLLVVGLNSDSSVQTLKGPTRPLNSIEARSAVLSGLQAVDYLTIFHESTPVELIRAVRPDVLVKGADYQKSEVVGAEFVESYGGRVHLAELRDGFSTTNLIQKMKVA